ncbi:MAG: hypothetical protein A3G81_16795 [Betaproteobacteria bacterium RIFCSPLOWO2_12_FULL_65_14]|nr:MAG: hypothetical protein A3G81_16795 [Betaproteobacteria bacterium RIFCSPLOWO2_12_FULL_65_14]
MLAVGDVAPDFAIGGRSLYRMLEGGSVVLFFFPKAFTPICTREASAFHREHERLARAGFEVVGVSTDRQETSDAFARSLGLRFPLVGDPQQRVARSYKVRWPLIGLARRVTYVIDPSRRIRVAHHREFGAESHVSAVCRQAELAESYHRGATFGRDTG